ncbi:MAG: hypothetical protein HQK56_14900 [Deltaproteobacteria bacterium]|nr:hypothetical protein [Deltaproteobacteria bacterium]
MGRIKMILWLLSVTLALLEIIMALGGYHTSLIHRHLMFSLFAVANVVACCAFMLYMFVNFAIKHHLVRSTMALLLLISIASGSWQAVNVLSQKSKNRAYHFVNSFFSGDATGYYLDIDQRMIHDFQYFCSNYDPSAIALVDANLLYGRYDFAVFPTGSNPFLVVVFMGELRVRIYVLDNSDP